MRRAAPCRRCPHGRDSHKPYIPGGDRPGYCTSCSCYQYKPERPWTRLLAWLRERPPPVTADVLRPRPVQFPVRGSAGYDDKTHLDIPLARPYAGALDEARLRVPRPRGGPPW